MAECIRYVCDNCGEAIEAWSDGNPYYIDESGKKHYAYHPDHENLARCIGNDSPHLCLACGKQFKVDSRVRRTGCSACDSPEIVDTFHLDGRDCPFCKAGVFADDPDFWCVS
jgi:protein-arginine kinase activator protein McsA